MGDLEEAKNETLKIFRNDRWVKWIHKGTIPAANNFEKKINAGLSLLVLHCSMCLNLNGCCFPKSNMPDSPLHRKCHCEVIPIAKISAKAECDIRKFTVYIFDDKHNREKKALFESWGYGIMDSAWLQAEFIRQAQDAYENGNFSLGKLDDYGQRIQIVITLPRKDKIGKVTFVSGWMVYPDGFIKNVTPYGA